MRQINLDIVREGYDGKKRTWAEIERLFKKRFEDDIIRRLKALINEEEQRLNFNNPRVEFLEWCKRETPRWLIAKPAELKIVRDIVFSQFRTMLADLPFRDKVLKAYGYDPKELHELASWLNIKTCPYCNMQYTLYTEVYEDDGTKEDLAKFQFDHFYDKAHYPMLSMSLYNLIPSCASCNHGKLQGDLGLEFHPYHASVGRLFRFRVANPVRLWMGSDRDVPEIDLEAVAGQNISDYDKMFHIKALYQRHKDVAREVFTRAYADPYYEEDNLSFLTDTELKERIRKGFYPEEKDIEKRPLTKLQQDLWEQAKGI